MNKSLILAIDIDLNLIKFKQDSDAIRVLKKLQERGHRISLCVSDNESSLTEKIKWFEENNISLYSEMPAEMQAIMSIFSKEYADIYIDARSIGAPIMSIGSELVLNWKAVEEILQERGIL